MPVISTDTNTSLEAYVPSLAGSATPALVSRSTSSTTLISIRGIPNCKSGSVDVSDLGEGAKQFVAKLLTVARLDPRDPDRGGELSDLITRLRRDPTLQNNPTHIEDLLSKLNQVATSTTLFGKSEAEYQSLGMDFKQLRREFLVEIIRGAGASDNITQGKEPLCTMTSACKLLPPGEFLRLATDFALYGSATTKSGAQLSVKPGFLEKAREASGGELGDVKCARRSPGFLMMLYAVADLGQDTPGGQPLVLHQQGAYWSQYTLMVENLLGEKVSCAHRTAKDLSIDPSSGHFVAKGTQTAKIVDLFGYVEAQLEQNRSVFIDTVFDFSSRSSAGSSEHCRHALVAEKFETINGERWVRCSNPIGNFVDTSKSRNNHAEFFPAGTELGQRSGFWFVTAENGDILVRADVLQRNIQTALVQTGEQYTFKPGDRPDFLGDPAAAVIAPILWFDLEQEKDDKESRSIAEQIQDKVQALASKLELFEKLNKDVPVSKDNHHPVVKDIGHEKTLSERLTEEALEVAQAEAREDTEEAKKERAELEEKEAKKAHLLG